MWRTATATSWCSARWTMPRNRPRPPDPPRPQRHRGRGRLVRSVDAGAPGDQLEALEERHDMTDAPDLSAFTGRTVLVTGVTGQVGFPVARALAADGHTVVGVARFSTPGRGAAHGRRRRPASPPTSSAATSPPCPPMSTTSPTSPWPRPATSRQRPGRQRRGPRAADAPLPRQPRPSCTARPPPSTSPTATTASPRAIRWATTTARSASCPPTRITKIAAEAMARYGARQSGPAHHHRPP